MLPGKSNYIDCGKRRDLNRSSPAAMHALGQHPMRRLVTIHEGPDIDDDGLAHFDPRFEGC